MPYSPRSYPLVDLPSGPDSMQSLSAIMSLAANLEEYQAQREQRQTEQRFKELSNEAKGDPLKTADLFESRYGDFGTGRILREKAGEIRQQAVDQMLTRVGDTKNPLVQGGQLLKEAEAHPALWPDLRGRVVDLASKLDPRLAQEIPEQYDQARVRGMLQFVEGGIVDLGATEQALKKLKAAQEATKNALERDKFYRESAAHWFSTPKTREQWEQVQQYGASMGIPATILQEFGEWSPDAPTRANEKLLTPEQRKMAQPTTIQAAILGARQRGDDGEVKELLALQRSFSGASREPDAAIDPRAVQAIVKYPHLWRAVNPELRGKLMVPLAQAGFNFPAAVEGLTPAEIERLRISDIRTLDRERRRRHPDTGKSWMSDEDYRDEVDRIDEFYRALAGEVPPPRVSTPPPPAATRGMLQPSTIQPAAGTVPTDVSALLANEQAGRYTLTDGSVWEKLTDGTVRKAQ